ncbi:hypothetical protein LV82_01004 [Albidovulum inexpectatum]|uniref:NADP-dependent 3-hydroxy acid dehydrogenase YdfG n=1 Tax=Albidovulum inexpectatum TaxID=196587 RepID=A0A2S5JJU4_9RHOB|nr:SDR family NAD(P)-dependent oxidoreductase [Albidovulum inexpectatum]PPB81787.1 hypothetical protein LV82_01004 [Albidovulum inexpectatum]
MNDTDTKIALVTGASRGLGFAMARELAARGYHVLAVARTVGALEELDDRIRETGGSATLAPLDITDDRAMAHLARSIMERWGRLDFWAHCAIHAAPLTPAGHLDPKDFDRSVACNMRATASLIPMLEPLLRASGGKALFFDDPHEGEKFFATYAATKAGQIALARAWAAESERIGPRVIIARPDPMPTATRARFFPGEDRAQLSDPASQARRILDAL